MKKIIALLVTIATLAGILFYRSNIHERELVVLSTNDIHAVIDNFPEFVTAVNLCRDTVTTLLVDGGDRWTGNAFIDRVEGRLPIIELMNHAGYDAVVVGNHEFDKGPAVLQGAIDYAHFPTLCANMQSNNPALTTTQGSITIKTRNGIKVFIAGVVTNYDNGHPDGSDDVFEGLEFSDPMEAAKRELENRGNANIAILLSHMGDDKDIKFASENSGYDMIVGGHTHMRVDTLVGKTSIGQTERLLSLLGVTRIRLKGNKVVSLDYENISFDGYAEDSATREIVDRIENDPVLGAVVGQLADSVTHTGFANMVTKVVAKATKADVGFYHYGGIRLRKHAAGDIKLATVYNLEPFESKIHTITMTPAQMRRMIITKFNDTKNSKESHRVDLFSTTPYTIIVDERGEATDVLFPKLRENRKYRVALSDYVGKKYEDIKGENHTKHDILVVDQLLKYLKESPVTPIDNQPHQKIVKR